MSSDKVVPNIRFRKFEKNWETEKLEKLGNTFPSLSGKSKKDFGHGNAKYITYMNVFTNPIALMSGTEAIEIDKKQNSVKYGDVFFTMSSETPEEVGMSSVWEYHLENVYLNSFSFGFRPNSKFDLNFLAFLLRSQGVRSQIVILAQGISRFNISKVKMMSINITFPINYFEQQKIGDFFTKLDKLLYLQQQKIDKLELLKKALLQKLFPKHDAKIPELRFKGYDHEWEEKKFSSLYKKCNEKNNLSFGNDKIISVANMYYKKDNVKSDDNYMKTYNIFRLGDIAFEGNKSKKFTFGRFVENTIGDGIVSHVFEVFRPISNGDITYWKYAIHNEDFIAPILMKSTVKATMMNNLIAKDFLKQRVPVPQLSEQQNIGNLLSKVDQLIELENKKLEDLQQFKKCLLQNMFVE